MIFIALFSIIAHGRLINLMRPKNNYLNFYQIAPSGVNPNDYTVVILADPKFGKYDMEHGGDGTNWDLDIDHMKQFCEDVNRMDPPPAFIAVTGDIAQALTHEDSMNIEIGPV